MEQETYEQGYDHLMYDPLEWADECAIAEAELMEKCKRHMEGETDEEEYSGFREDQEAWDDVLGESVYP